MIAAVGLMLLGMTGPASAEPVRVRAAPHDGYGRMVFNWSSPVRFETETADGQLVVRFARPIEADYSAAVQLLSRYVAAAQPGADGRSVTFTLRRPFAVRSFDLGSAVVVDLIEPGTGGADAGSEGVEPTDSPAESVGVRTGEHEGYSRLVFDWSRNVGFRAGKEGDRVTVQFDRPARIDLGGLRGRRMRYVSGAASRVEAGETAVTLTVPEDVGLRTARLGTRIVVDVLAPRPAAAETPPESPTPTPTPTPTPSATTAPAEAPAPSPPPPRETAVSEPAPDRPTPLIPDKPAGATAAQAPAPETAPVAPVESRPLGDGVDKVVLRFDWQEPTAAAVFRRAGYVWAVFDRPAEQDVQALRAAGGNVVRAVEQLPNARATVVRMDIIGDVNPTVRRDGLAWVLELRQQPLAPETDIESNAQPNSPAGARLFLPVAEPGDAIPVADPEVGDTLVVVPVVPLGHGIATAYDYPQLRILPSAQGIVLEPRIDTLRVRPLRQGVELTAPGALLMTPVSARTRANAKAAGPAVLSRAIDIGRFRDRDLSTFSDDKQALQNAIVRSVGAQKEKARLDLARFYFAHGFAPESLGVLERAADERPELRNEPEFRAMSGANRYMLGRLNAARRDLTHDSLDDNDEGAFWRAAVQAAEGDVVGATGELKRTGSIIRRYPKALKVPLGSMVAEAAIEVGDIRQAGHFLDLLLVEAPDPRQQGRLDYVEGRLLELSGDFGGAVGKWEQAQVSRHRPSVAAASMARAELLLKLRQITQMEAIEELEKLRFVWRGNGFEFNLLKRLGQLYLDEGDYRAGLRSLKQAATHFRDNPETTDITQQMADTFEELYLEGGADEMPPVTAIALYDEFRELTPVGDKGNEMIRKLADRLVGVDLLDRAAALLEDQVRFRLKGEEKAQIGARLALVRLLDDNADAALTALDQSEMPDLPEALTVQRRHLRARALAETGSIEDALLLLEDDESPDADLIRADVFWSIRDWSRASQVLRRIVRETGARPGEPLEDNQGRRILDLTVALTLSGNERGLARVRSNYGAAMDASPFRDAFRLIATPEAAAPIDVAAVAKKVTDVENFQAFMTTYRERLREQQLSAMN